MSRVSPPALEAASPRILLVDDEEVNHRFLRVLLERNGLPDLIWTPDPREALPLCLAFPPDLVLLDLHMPGMDGFQVLDQLRATLPREDFLPILMVTGDTSLEIRQRALGGGATDFLTKPFDAVETLLRIRNLLHTRALQTAVREQNRQLEEAVAERTRDLQIALRRAEAVSEVKTQFLAKISHELRTPLSPIRGALELLKEYDLPEPVLMLVQMASNNTDRIVTLINEILYLQTLEQGEVRLAPIPIQLGALLRDVVREMEERAREAGLEVRTEIPEQLPPVTTDPVRMADVVRRLLHNAIRFTPAGEVTVRVVADGGGRRVRRIEIQDTGIGIPREKQETMFAPFEQVDNSSTRRYEGAGIGLTICRALCRLMGYRLEVDSEPGRGSTFRILL